MKNFKKIFWVFIVILGFISSCGRTDEYDEKKDGFYTEKDELTESIPAIEFTEEKNDTNRVDIEEEFSKIYEEIISSITEDSFKSNCKEIDYNDLDESWIGSFVTKELIFNASNTGEYKCGATEDFVEDVKVYQKTYKTYNIYDCRFDNSFPIFDNDVIKIYGVITDVRYNFANGLYFPIIDMYYIEYVREWRKPVDNEKSIDDIINERNEYIRKEKERIEYLDSLNSDYEGETKNVENMSDLDISEYISYCDKINYRDLYSGEDFTGRHVSIHVQLFEHKIFTSEKGKENRLGKWTNIELVCDDVWKVTIYNERAEDYIADFGMLFF